MTPRLKYTPHHKKHAEGHLHWNAPIGVPCVINVVGAAAMKQSQLNKVMRTMVKICNLSLRPRRIAMRRYL